MADLLKRGDCQPQTVPNYLSHRGKIVYIPRLANSTNLDRCVMHDSLEACKRLNMTPKSVRRLRHPIREELTRRRKRLRTRRGM